MAKESLIVTIAGIKAKLFTSNPEEVTRMASSLDTTIRKYTASAGGAQDRAMLMLILQQAEQLKKNAELIHSQQEQIFSLVSKNGALLGEAPESAPVIEAENALLLENSRLRRRIDELTDEIAALSAALSADGE
jgi:hypothetical protein